MIATVTGGAADQRGEVEGETDVGFKPMIALPTAGGKGREGSRRKFFRQGNETVWIDGVLSHDRERLIMRSETATVIKYKTIVSNRELELLFWVRFVWLNFASIVSTKLSSSFSGALCTLPFFVRRCISAICVETDKCRIKLFVKCISDSHLL